MGLIVGLVASALNVHPKGGAQAAADPSPIVVASPPATVASATPEPTPTHLPTSTPTPTRPPTLGPTARPAGSPPTRIVAPAIELDAPVVEVGFKITYLGDSTATAWLVPDDAAGFHRGSAYPGLPGNTVISGHHNMGSEVFRYLVDLEIGDEVILYVGEKPFHYRVQHKEIVREFGVGDEQRRENARWIAPTDDERLTLVTCWPYSGNSHRVIVVAWPLP